MMADVCLYDGVYALGCAHERMTVVLTVFI